MHTSSMVRKVVNDFVSGDGLSHTDRAWCLEVSRKKKWALNEMIKLTGAGRFSGVSNDLCCYDTKSIVGIRSFTCRWIEYAKCSYHRYIEPIDATAANDERGRMRKFNTLQQRESCSVRSIDYRLLLKAVVPPSYAI
jgi:hypothetical protein